MAWPRSRNLGLLAVNPIQHLFSHRHQMGHREQMTGLLASQKQSSFYLWIPMKSGSFLSDSVNGSQQHSQEWIVLCHCIMPFVVCCWVFWNVLLCPLLWRKYPTMSQTSKLLKSSLNICRNYLLLSRAPCILPSPTGAYNFMITSAD